MKLVIGTPKALSRIEEFKDKLPSEYKVQPTTEVYVNMLFGWTEAECDDVIYLVDEDSLPTVGDSPLILQE